jgi:SSS family solute:Na+ symporter
MGLYAFEIALLVVYLLATFGLAIYFGRKGREAASATEYFLAGRALPWYLIGLSFYASNMSGASFVGLIGASYAHGLVIFHYEWTAALVLVVFAAIILPVFLRTRLFTVTEYLERRFEPRTRRLYSLFTLVTLLFIDMAGALYAGAIVMVTGLPFLDLWAACLIISLLTGLYTIFGGLRTVVITDALQALVLIVGASVVAVYGLAHVGGWDALLADLDHDKLELFHAPDDDVLPCPAFWGWSSSGSITGPSTSIRAAGACGPVAAAGALGRAVRRAAQASQSDRAWPCGGCALSNPGKSRQGIPDLDL